MGIAQKTETFVSPEDHSWLGKSNGFEAMDSITLDIDSFLTTWPTGDVPSGVCLGALTALVDGVRVYAPYDADNTDGTEVMAGHLGTSKSLGTVVGQLEPAPLFWGPGEVIEANLPTDSGIDEDAKTAMTLIRYV